MPDVYAKTKVSHKMPEQLRKDLISLMRREPDWSSIPDYYHWMLADYVVHGKQVSEFLHHVVINDLYRAVETASADDRKNLFAWVSVMRCEMPQESVGTYQKYFNWNGLANNGTVPAGFQGHNEELK